MELNEAITIYLAENIPNLSQTKWNKLMFFIDGVGFCEHSETYSKYKYIRLPFGPVPENYREKIEAMLRKEYLKKDRYIGVADAVTYIETYPKYINEAEDILKQSINGKKNQTELPDVLKQIVGIFKNWSAFKMSDLSHELTVWKKPPLGGEIDFELLKNDSFLEREFDEANFAKVIMAPLKRNQSVGELPLENNDQLF